MAASATAVFGTLAVSAGTPATVALGAVAAGSTLIVVGWWSDATGTSAAAPTCSDSTNGSYGTKIFDIYDATNQQRMVAWKFLSSAANGAITATVTATGNQNYFGAMGFVVTGNDALSVTVIGQVQAAPTTTVGATTSTALTPTSQPGLLLGLTGISGAGSSTPAAHTAGGFTDLGAGWLDGFNVGRAESKAFSSTAPIAATFTAGSNVAHEVVAFAVYDAGGGGGGGSVPIGRERPVLVPGEFNRRVPPFWPPSEVPRLRRVPANQTHLRSYSLGVTVSPTAAKQSKLLRSLSAAVTSTVTRRPSLVRAQSVATTPTTAKQPQLVRAQTSTVTPSSSSLKAAARDYPLSVAVTLAPATQVQVARALSVAATLSSAKLLALLRSYAVSATATVTTAKQAQLVRALTVTVSPSTSALKVALRSYALAVAVTVTVLWQVGLVRALAVLATLSTVKAAQLVRSSSVAVTAGAVALKVALRSYSVSVATTLAASKQALLARSVSVAVAMAQVTQLRRVFALVATVTAERVVEVQRVFARSVAVTAGITSLMPHALTVALSVLLTPSVTKRPELSRALSVGAQLSIARRVALVVALPITVTASIARRFARSFSVLVSALVAIASEVLPDAGPATGTLAKLDIQTERVILRVGMQKAIVGTRHRLHASFYTFGDSRLKDPDSVTFSINGVEFAGVREGVGVYHYDYIPTEAGRYRVVATGVGAVAAVAEASFEARELS